MLGLTFCCYSQDPTNLRETNALDQLASDPCQCLLIHAVVEEQVSTPKKAESDSAATIPEVGQKGEANDANERGRRRAAMRRRAVNTWYRVRDVIIELRGKVPRTSWRQKKAAELLDRLERLEEEQVQVLEEQQVQLIQEDLKYTQVDSQESPKEDVCCYHFCVHSHRPGCSPHAGYSEYGA